ncbi:Crp/Fnr family transcriptional regulator [Aquicella lusitana]|uniref:CRP/FNR family transcriptional regulator n=1 Tax=Aquicella lusitana TaxID=254246 RepID=A0A370GHZ0_9COXI|nr:helix-turn-helix domain-containing protein [Aquicella lusitana]RDI43402.1 CRP/FNR family transcriptional regulator [Aquicella lusitana]VVC73552.1 Transcriptional activator protein Anr [Aquicella lusitana]
MHSSATSNPTCNLCLFAPFCTSEEEILHTGRQASLAVKQYRKLNRNEVLCLPNNKFQNLYAIQKGTLKTYQVEADGRELIREFYFAGEILGYEAIYTGHYPFSAVAISETLICEIPYANFLKLLHSKPALQRRILYLISRQLNIGSYLVSTTAEQRLAAFLIELATRLHPAETRYAFLLPMSRQDIGNYLRLSAETISRVFSRLQKNKMILIDHKKINLLQPDKLKQVADGLWTSNKGNTVK